MAISMPIEHANALTVFTENTINSNAPMNLYFSLFILYKGIEQFKAPVIL